MTNSARIAQRLRRSQCTMQREHAHLTDSNAKACELYPKRFCEDICMDFREELLDRVQDCEVNGQTRCNMTLDVQTEGGPHLHDDFDDDFHLYQDFNFTMTLLDNISSVPTVSVWQAMTGRIWKPRCANLHARPVTHSDGFAAISAKHLPLHCEFGAPDQLRHGNCLLLRPACCLPRTTKEAKRVKQSFGSACGDSCVVIWLNC